MRKFRARDSEKIFFSSLFFSFLFFSNNCREIDLIEWNIIGLKRFKSKGEIPVTRWILSNVNVGYFFVVSIRKKAHDKTIVRFGNFLIMKVREFVEVKFTFLKIEEFLNFL